MLRLSRTRQNDPVWENPKRKSFQRFGTWNAPAVTRFGQHDVVFGVSVDEVTRDVPTHDERRRILATDSLALVEGFRVMVLLTLQHSIGMNFCVNCPHCCESETPCVDLFGSCALSEGGIFGRVDAVVTSLEAKKKHGAFACTFASIRAVLASALTYVGNCQKVRKRILQLRIRKSYVDTWITKLV